MDFIGQASFFPIVPNAEKKEGRKKAHGKKYAMCLQLANKLQASF
jgi:hypothetical protein